MLDVGPIGVCPFLGAMEISNIFLDRAVIVVWMLLQVEEQEATEFAKKVAVLLGIRGFRLPLDSFREDICVGLQGLGERALSKERCARGDAGLQRIEYADTLWKFGHDVKPHAFANARRFTFANGRSATGDERSGEIRLLLLIAGDHIEALADLAFGSRLPRFTGIRELGLHQVTLFSQSAKDVERQRLTDDEIVAAVVNGIAFSDQGVTCAVRITRQAEAADDAMTVKGPMV